MKKFIKKNALYISVIIVGMLFILAIIVRTKFKKVYEPTGNSTHYTVITNVTGLEFDMHKNLLDGCSFSTGILDTEQLNNGKTYVYRNDTTDYLLYNSKQVSVVVKKIESVGLKGQKKAQIKESLSKLYFLNTSILSNPKDITYRAKKKGAVTKYMITKPIEVGIAPNVLSFQKYYGYMAYLECTNGEAYAIFAGTPHPEEEWDKTVNKFLYHVVASTHVVSLSDTSDISKNEVEETEVNKTDVSTDVKEIPEQEAKKESTSVEKTEESVEAVSENEPISIEVKEEPIPPEPSEPKTDDYVADLPSSTHKLNDPIQVSAYNGTVTESLVGVKITRLSRNAKEEVKENDKDYFAPSEGCHLELIEYELVNPQSEYDLVRVNVVGEDFEKLAYNGIKYSKRTYEYTKNGKLYAYYEIPNGCKEYVLEIGGITEKGYFYVKE